MKLDFSMSKAGDKNVGPIEIQTKDGDYAIYDIVKRGRLYLIGGFTNTGLLSDYYYKMEPGESDQRALEEINADLEFLATDGERAMSRVKKIPKKGLKKNPPFYAHHLYEKKTHGLSLKQMKRLYRMVSAGNQKAITYARNVLGIPFSESASQVKAVVYHHVRDLMGERKVRRNAGRGTPWSKVLNAFRKSGFQFHAYGTADDPKTGKKLYDWYRGDTLTERQKEIILSLVPSAQFQTSGPQYAPEIRKPTVIFPVSTTVRRNPGEGFQKALEAKKRVHALVKGIWQTYRTSFGYKADKMDMDFERQIVDGDVRNMSMPELANAFDFIGKRSGYSGKDLIRMWNSRNQIAVNPRGSREVSVFDYHRTKIAIQTVKSPMKGYFLGGPDLAESVSYLRSRGYTMAQLKRLNPDVEDILAGRKSILPNKRRKRK